MTDQAGAHTPGPWTVKESDVEVIRNVRDYAFQSGFMNDVEAFHRIIALIDSVPAMAEELERLKKAGADYDREVTQILGRALGYPKYCDDPANFPGATKTDGVCVGEHVAVTLAQEVAEELARLRALKAQLVEAVKGTLAVLQAINAAFPNNGEFENIPEIIAAREVLAAILAAEGK